MVPINSLTGAKTTTDSTQTSPPKTNDEKHNEESRSMFSRWNDDAIIEKSIEKKKKKCGLRRNGICSQ